MLARCFLLLSGGLLFFVPWLCGGQALDVVDLLKAIQMQTQKGDYTDALASANQLIQLEPRNAQGYVARGSVYEIKGEYDKAIADYSHALSLDTNSAQIYQLRGAAYFKAAKVTEAAGDFDKVVKLQPARLPHHWQRGIALYEAGRFDEGRKQFEAHQTVNSNDVENATWHFLCVAKSKNFDEARKSLLPIENDRRVPMMEVYAFYQGKGKIDDIFNAAKKNSPSEKELNHRLFYANLYVGMFFEARGGNEQALDYVKKAVEKSEGMDYMADVARVHAELLKKRLAAKPASVK